jgi:hypothetical protein
MVAITKIVCDAALLCTMSLSNGNTYDYLQNFAFFEGALVEDKGYEVCIPICTMDEKPKPEESSEINKGSSPPVGGLW